MKTQMNTATIYSVCIMFSSLDFFHPSLHFKMTTVTFQIMFWRVCASTVHCVYRSSYTS